MLDKKTKQRDGCGWTEVKEREKTGFRMEINSTTVWHNLLRVII